MPKKTILAALLMVTTLAPPAEAGDVPALPQGITLDGPAGSDGRTVFFNPRGRMAVMLGDPRLVHDVAVIVPGSDVDIPRFGRTLLPKARAMYQEAHGDLAVIAWLGYQTPEGLGVDAATGRLARAGAAALSAFITWLHKATSARVHVYGHSYGSVVCALAKIDVDDLVFIGSPGVRAGSVAELGGRAQVWAARAPADWTRWIPHFQLGDLGHGTDPTSPEFGARTFGTGGALGHDDYFHPGTESLRNLVRIGLGRYGEVR
jgi:hypothetical protein